MLSIRSGFFLKYAPAICSSVFLASAAAIGTHFALKTLYGVPAPAVAVESQAPLMAAPVPAWLAGGPSAQASDLVLLGVAAQGAQGLALVQVVGGERAKVYAIGQTLPNGAILKAVNPRSITLDAQGSVQTVALDSKTSGGAAAINPQRAAQAALGAMPGAELPAGFPNPMVSQATIPSPPPQPSASSRVAAAKRLRTAPEAVLAP